MPRVDLSLEDAQAIVLGALSRLVEHALLSVDETRLSSGAIESTLHLLVQAGLASVEGSLECRVFVLTEKGRSRLGGGRVVRMPDPHESRINKALGRPEKS